MSTATAVSFRIPATSGEGGDFELPPSGSHPAILIGIVDLGTRDNTYNGKTSKRHKIMLAWELTAENDSKGQTFVVAQDYTWSLNSKAQLRTIVEGFRGKGLAAISHGGDERMQLLRARRMSGAAIGIIGAVGAFGGVLINMAFRQSFLVAKTGDPAFWAFIAFYLVCIAVTYLVYLRPAPADVRHPRTAYAGV